MSGTEDPRGPLGEEPAALEQIEEVGELEDLGEHEEPGTAGPAALS